MGRPRKEGLEYFLHDVSASSDDKLELLEAKYGNDGYATYFKLLEFSARNSAGTVSVNNPELESFYAGKCHVSVERFREILNSAITLRLFDEEALLLNGILKSERLYRHVRSITGARERSRASYDQESDKKKSIYKSRLKEKTQKSTETTQKQSRNGVEKHQYLDFVYLSEADLKELTRFYSEKGLTNADINDAIRYLDTWYDNNPKMRAKRTNDCKTLKGWPLQKVQEAKASQLKLQTQQAYKDSAELTAFNKVSQ